MATKTSATGGPLVPSPSPAPLQGDALENVLHDLVAGITGFAASSIRPRWQNRPLPLPSAASDWCAFGVTGISASGFAHVRHEGGGDGSDTMTRTEELDALVSFYGPNAYANAELMRDGLSVTQNLEPLQLLSIGLIETGPVMVLPDLINAQWFRRCDLNIRLRRAVVRSYPILNILSADPTITPA